MAVTMKWMISWDIVLYVVGYNILLVIAGVVVGLSIAFILDRRDKRREQRNHGD